MPIFEFRCKECKQVFEKLVSVSASGDQQCPHCGGREVSKLLSVFAASGGAAGMRAGGPSGGCCGGGCGCH